MDGKRLSATISDQVVLPKVYNPVVMGIVGYIEIFLHSKLGLDIL